MDLPSQMALFAKVVESGSFSAAARTLNHSPSAVSRQIGMLEDRLGLRLLNRSAGGVILTEEGRAVHARSAELVASVGAVEAMAEAAHDEPQGRLRVASTVAFGKTQILPFLDGFLRTHPRVDVTLTLTDRDVDLRQGEHEVSIRFTEQVHDDELVLRRLAPNRRVLVASPAYLARAGTPRRAADLRQHQILRLTTVNGWNDWGMVDEAGRPVPLRGRVELNSADMVHLAALNGLGLARLSTYLVNDDIRSGRLVRVLPDYVQMDSDIVALFLSRRNLPRRIRAFIDWLTARLGPVPPWEREAG